MISTADFFACIPSGVQFTDREDTISESRCSEWLARSKSGDTSLEDKPGRGRPSDFDDQAPLGTVEGDSNAGRQVQCGLFKHCSSSRKAWKGVQIGWMVTREPSDNIKTERALIFSGLLQENGRGPFLKDLVAGDESWLLFKNLKRKEDYVWLGVSQKGIMKDVHSKKAMW
uniref:Uncharacterized protein n=1 Tax=Glossina pallidipes TaxID=7398 RepID=A0A1B0ACA7_GLOPL